METRQPEFNFAKTLKRHNYIQTCEFYNYTVSFKRQTYYSEEDGNILNAKNRLKPEPQNLNIVRDKARHFLKKQISKFKDAIRQHAEHDDTVRNANNSII